MIRRRTVWTMCVGLALLIAPSSQARADSITVLCSTGLKAVVDDLVPKFEAATKHKVTLSFTVAAVLKQRIDAGEAYDVAVLTPALVDDLIKAGRMSADARTSIARSPLALAIRAGARRRDISTVAAFKSALLDATSVSYTKEGASGVFFASLIQRLGIADALKPKTKLVVGATDVGAAVAGGEAEYGVLPVSEILPIQGVEVLAPFPTDAQSFIVMVGGVSSTSKAPAAARELLKFLVAPSAVPVLKAKGMEPI